MNSELNQQSLEECLVAIWNMTNAHGEAIAVRPTKLFVHPSNFKMARKMVLRAYGGYKNTPRWRYLVRRGARR